MNFGLWIICVEEEIGWGGKGLICLQIVIKSHESLTRDARCYFVVFRSSFSVLNKNGNFKTLILIWASF